MMTKKLIAAFLLTTPVVHAETLLGGLFGPKEAPDLSPFAVHRRSLAEQIQEPKVAASVGATLGKGVDSVLSVPGRVVNVGDDLPPMLSKGTQEFGVSGAVNFADDIAYNMNLNYGWFIRDRWQVGFGLGVQGVESDINFSLGLFTEYHFCLSPSSKWVPFVGFSAAWAKLDSDAFDADSIALGLDFGVKYFIRENIALSFSIGADYAFDDVFPGGDDFAEQINIGTRFYF